MRFMRGKGAIVWALALVLAGSGQVAMAAEQPDNSSATTTQPKPVESSSGGQGEPVKETQFVYSLSPWTGKEYGGTFAPRQVDTMHLMAGVDNVVNTLRSDVYYWPITQEYMADWFGFKEEVPGTLEILQGDQVVRSLQKVDYVYVFPEGAYGPETKLVTGPQAHEEFARFERLQDEYWDAVSAYYEADAEYRKKMDALLERVMKTNKPAKPEEIPTAPQQPEPPKLYVTQPVQAFIVNLPPGRYQVRLVDENGSVVEHSTKTLEVFAARRSGVGFEILPESKWTRPITSDDASAVLYMEGKRVFYLKPFAEQEYNSYSYAKMNKLHAPLEGAGLKSRWEWVHEAPLNGQTLQVLKGGQVVQEVKQEGFYVQQTPGYALGYNIVKFDPEAPGMEGRSPSFEAYRVELEASGRYKLRLVDENGNVIPGSERDIRPVNVTSGWLLYGIPFLPLLVGLIVFASRRNFWRSHKQATSTPVPA